MRQSLVATDNVTGEFIDFSRSKNRFGRFNWKFLQPTVRLHQRRLVRRKKQVRHAVPTGDHRRQEIVNDFFVHLANR